MNLLKIARVPAPTVSPDATVLEAVEKMVEVGVGAVVVVDQDNEIKGIVTERDILQRVAKNCLPCDTTKVSDVMSSSVKVAHVDTNPSEVLTMMDSGHFRHMPIVDDEQRVERDPLHSALAPPYCGRSFSGTAGPRFLRERGWDWGIGFKPVKAKTAAASPLPDIVGPAVPS